MPCAQASDSGSASGTIEPGVRATVLTEEQKLKLAGRGACAARHRSMRLRAPAMQSLSKLDNRLLKFTDQAQCTKDTMPDLRCE